MSSADGNIAILSCPCRRCHSLTAFCCGCGCGCGGCRHAGVVRGVHAAHECHDGGDHRGTNRRAGRAGAREPLRRGRPGGAGAVHVPPVARGRAPGAVEVWVRRVHGVRAVIEPRAVPAGAFYTPDLGPLWPCFGPFEALSEALFGPSPGPALALLWHLFGPCLALSRTLS